MQIGDRFGKLVIIGFEAPRKVVVQCDCGNVTKPLRANVRRGFTRSCGCWQRSQAAAILNALRAAKTEPAK